MEKTRTKRIRLLSYNLWHGLDHTRPLLMLPAETPWQHRARWKAQLEILKQHCSENAANNSLDLIALQEANPISRVKERLAKELQLQSHSFSVNTGARVGRISYPFFLEEGLANFFSTGVEDHRCEKLFLSGTGLDLEVLGIPLSFHLAERRAALISHFQWQGLQLSFVNLHLHAGPAETSSKRRTEEVLALLNRLQKSSTQSDVVFIAGDFNAREEDPEIQILLREGFRRISGGPSLETWNPEQNTLCRKNAEMDLLPSWRDWDMITKSIDHIFMKVKKGHGSCAVDKAKLFGTQRLKGSFLSDHFGISVELTWKAEK